MTAGAAAWGGFPDAFAHLFLAQMKGVPAAALCLFTVLASAAVFWGAAAYSRKSGKRVPLRRRLLLCMLLFYTFFLAAITLMNREPGSRGGVSPDILAAFLTGQAGGLHQLVYAALNVILFLPLGVLLAFWWEEDGGLWRVVMVTLCCFVCSFVVELLQLVSARGYFELADIAANTLGGLAGALFAGLLLHLTARGGTRR